MIINKFKIGKFLSFFILFIKNIPALKYHDLDDKETIKHLIQTKKSLIRWGDGETNIALGGSIYFQEGSKTLQTQLKTILSQYNIDSPFLVALPNDFLRKNLFKIPFSKWLVWMRTRELMKKLINNSIHYGDALVFRKYIINEHNDYESNICDLWKDDANLIVVNSSESGYIESLGLTGAHTLYHVPIPDKNAFEYIQEAKESIMSIINNNHIDSNNTAIIVSAGPMAKILVYTFSVLGYRGYDVGFLLNPKPILEKYKKCKS